MKGFDPATVLQDSQRHFHEFRHAGCLHFRHHISAVDFHGSSANAKLLCDVSARLPFDQTRQYLFFPFAQDCEPLSDHLCFGVRPMFAVPPRQRRANGREQSVAVERLLEEIDRSPFHCGDRQRNIGMRGDDDDRQRDAALFLRIPTQAGRGFRFDPGQGSDLMSATIPR